MNKDLALIIVVAIACVLGGVWLLSKPHVIQRSALKYYEKRWNPFYKFMQSPDYIWSVRACGLILLAMAGILVYAAILGLSE